MRNAVRAAALMLLWFAPPASAQAPGMAGTPAASRSIAADSRTFELRTYHAHPGRLEDLHARFRHHTIRLFEKHGMTVVAFWAPTAPADAAGHTLVYVLAYPNEAARHASWKAFGSDPEWIAARDASERNGKLVAKVGSVMMRATDYSAIK